MSPVKKTKPSSKISEDSSVRRMEEEQAKALQVKKDEKKRKAEEKRQREKEEADQKAAQEKEDRERKEREREAARKKSALKKPEPTWRVQPQTAEEKKRELRDGVLQTSEYYFP